jgi:hypothetical protein
VGSDEAQRAWQRQYGKPVAADRETNREQDPNDADVAAVSLTGCLPGWLGALALALTTAVIVLRRLLRRA